MSYVRAARELEFLTDEEIDRKAKEYGLVEAMEKDEEEVLGVHHDAEKGKSSGVE